MQFILTIIKLFSKLLCVIIAIDAFLFFLFGVCIKFLIEILSNLNSTRVTFKLSEPNKAGLIIPDEIDDSEDIIMLVMPVMLNDYA